jgi:hypothetical protein
MDNYIIHSNLVNDQHSKLSSSTSSSSLISTITDASLSSIANVHTAVTKGTNSLPLLRF